MRVKPPPKGKFWTESKRFGFSFQVYHHFTLDKLLSFSELHVFSCEKQVLEEMMSWGLF